MESTGRMYGKYAISFSFDSGPRQVHVLSKCPSIWHARKVCRSVARAHGGAKEPSYLGLLCIVPLGSSGQTKSRSVGTQGTFTG